MTTLNRIAAGTGRATSTCATCVLALALAGAGVVRAQYVVDQRVNLQVQNQSGQLFDANPSVLGGRVNAGGYRPMSPLVGGNAYATGNVGRGLSLRSYSPIADPTAFGAPLGSASLYQFRRDSVSAFDALNGNTGSFAQPYYDPSTTAITGGLLQGQLPSQLPGATINRSIARLPGSQFAAGGAGLQSSALDASLPYGPARPPAAYSSIFGPGPADPMSVPRLPIPTVVDQDAALRNALGRGQAPLDRGSLVFGPSARPSADSNVAIATPLSTALRADSSLLLGPVTPELTDATGLGNRATGLRPGLVIPDRAVDAAPGTTPPTSVDPSVLPGYDVYTDMRIALALEHSPNAAWFEDMQKAALSSAELAPKPAEAAVKNSEQFKDEMLKSPLRSFAGKGSSTVNDLMLKAETLLNIGNYAEAADRYRSAHMVDPTNPLPLMGRGHALLAAGDYRQATASLLAGIEAFPELSRFSFDLTSMLGGGENVDIRRADLMRRLAERESPELRFLLGYLEYNAGDKTRGLADLDKAAALDKGASMISRFPSVLRGTAPLPPPKLAPAGEPPSYAPRPAAPAGESLNVPPQPDVQPTTQSASGG